jgi:hypothetical protein
MMNNSGMSAVRLGGSSKWTKYVIGALVLALLAAGAKFLFMDQARYLVPTQTVAQGSSLATVSWGEVSANLGGLAAVYLPAGKIPTGFAANDLAAGQLVAATSVSQWAPKQLNRVVVTSKTQLSQNVRAGASVAVWAAKKVQMAYDVPTLLVASAKVARVVKAQGGFSAQNQQVELLVDPNDAPILLDAMAGDSAIFLVANQ